MKLKLILSSVLSAAAVLVLVAATTQGAAKKRGKCSVPGGEVLLQNDDGRIIRGKSSFAKDSVEVRKVYACLFRAGRLVALGTDRTHLRTGICDEPGCTAPAEHHIRSVDLEEGLAAFSIQDCTAGRIDERTCDAHVRMQWLGSGRRATWPAGVRVWSLEALSSAGYVAFISSRADGVDEVHRLRRGEKDTVLDSGTDIDAGSLAVPRGWIDAGGSSGSGSGRFFWETEDGARAADFK